MADTEYALMTINSMATDLGHLRRENFGEMSRHEIQEVMQRLREHRRELDTVLYEIEEHQQEHMYAAFEKCARVGDTVDKLEEAVQTLQERIHRGR